FLRRECRAVLFALVYLRQTDVCQVPLPWIYLSESLVPRRGDDPSKDPEEFNHGLVVESSLVRDLLGFYSGNQFSCLWVVQRSERHTADNSVQVSDCGGVGINRVCAYRFPRLGIDNASCFDFREPPSSLSFECGRECNAFPNLFHIEHTCFAHGLMEFKHGAHSVPAQSKRDSNFGLLGLSRYVHSKEAVGPLLWKPRVRLLASFLIHVSTLPDFRLRVACYNDSTRHGFSPCSCRIGLPCASGECTGEDRGMQRCGA